MHWRSRSFTRLTDEVPEASQAPEGYAAVLHAAERLFATLTAVMSTGADPASAPRTTRRHRTARIRADITSCQPKPPPPAALLDGNGDGNVEMVR